MLGALRFPSSSSSDIHHGPNAPSGQVAARHLSDYRVGHSTSADHSVSRCIDTDRRTEHQGILFLVVGRTRSLLGSHVVVRVTVIEIAIVLLTVIVIVIVTVIVIAIVLVLLIVKAIVIAIIAINSDSNSKNI